MESSNDVSFVSNDVSNSKKVVSTTEVNVPDEQALVVRSLLNYDAPHYLASNYSMLK